MIRVEANRLGKTGNGLNRTYATQTGKSFDPFPLTGLSGQEIIRFAKDEVHLRIVWIGMQGAARRLNGQIQCSRRTIVQEIHKDSGLPRRQEQEASAQTTGADLVGKHERGVPAAPGRPHYFKEFQKAGGLL